MPNAYKLSALTDVRKAAGLTLEQMANACGLYKKKSRESAGAWERGQSVPNARLRPKFIDYLGNTLGLQASPQRFHEVWQILVDEWEWEPVNDDEWQQHFGSDQHKVSLPTLPEPAFTVDAAALALAEVQLEHIPTTGRQLPPRQSLPAGSLMPFRHNPLFVGRRTDLQALATRFKGGNPTSTVVITGLGGMGKTQLASEFVHRYGQYFAGGVFWLSFADGNGVPIEVAACGDLSHLNLHPNFDGLPLDRRVRLVRAAWQSALPRLLIFDNCEDERLLEQWRPPTGGCRVLVTSRRLRWEPTRDVHVLSLAVLDRTESMDLLRHYRPDLDPDDSVLSELAAEVGDLPLALHLAGTYLTRYRFAISPSTYLHQLRSPALFEHPSLQADDYSPTGHHRGVGRSFALSYERLSPTLATDKVALALLARAAHFAPGEPTPRDLLIETIHPHPDEAARIQGEDALIRLVELGLVTEENNGVVRLHRLLAAFIRTISLDTTAQSAVEDIMLLTARRFNADDRLIPSLLLLHLRAVTNAALSRTDHDAGNLCYEISKLLFQIDEGGAFYYNERSLAIRTTLLGPNHPGITENLHHMGWMLDTIGRYPEAHHYHEEALVIRTAAFGSHHPDTAESLNYMGTIRHQQNDYGAARHYYEQALVIREALLAEDHPDVTTSLNNLGLLLHAQGYYREARCYHERALSIRERVLAPNHAKVGITLNNLGYLLRAQAEYTLARLYLERALTIREEVFGPDNAYIAVTLNHIGRLLHMQGDYADAQAYLERALAIRKQSFDPNHTDIGNSLGNIGMLLFDRGDYEDARPYLEQALAVHQQVWGINHRHTARSLNHLGMLLHAQDNYSDARRYIEQALDVRERILGSHHADTGNSLGNLGMILHTQGDTLQARPLLERALAIHQHALGPEHPYTARSNMRLGLIIGPGNHQAAHYLDRALVSYENVLGGDHPYTRICRDHVNRLGIDVKSLEHRS